MGMILFLTVVIVEVLFAVFCLITKSDHRKERSVIRIAFFPCFVTLVILAVIDWNFRYYALGLCLISIENSLLKIKKAFHFQVSAFFYAIL